MKYPSQCLHDLADRLDPAEDDVLERLCSVKSWAGGWKVWTWRKQAKRIQNLESKNRALVYELKKLSDLYRHETGKVPPTNMILVLADYEAARKAMENIRTALSNLTRRLAE